MPPVTGRVVMAAPAKLTLSLRIVGVRPDGYHLIDAEMVSLDLADTLEFSAGDSLEVVTPGQGTGGLPVPGGDDNLVRRALASVGRRAAVRLVKRIPAGGGLGGGSADAAAALRWAGCTDLAVAAALGADVPFCLVGGRARVSGIGETVTPLPFERSKGGRIRWSRPLSAFPPPPSTSGGTPSAGRDADGVNDLETAALAVAPELAKWRDRLGDATSQTPTLAGSGSTWFVAGAYPGPGRTVVRIARPNDLIDQLRSWLLAGASLPAGRLQHLLMLLLAHALAALLDQRSHGNSLPYRLAVAWANRSHSALPALPDMCNAGRAGGG